MQPGCSGTSITKENLTVDMLLSAIAADSIAFGFRFVATTKNSKCSVGGYKVALVLDIQNDYHWYRQNTDGTWSHKRGNTEVINYDASGDIIYNPETADRYYPDDEDTLNYSTFVGYYEVTPLNDLYFPNTTNTNQDVVWLPQDDYAETYGYINSVEAYVGG